uniref:Uncharacterized protein n=1 Tax=Arundo donax TaxID=35708 RepID=A0A0A9BUV4_ARUDO
MNCTPSCQCFCVVLFLFGMCFFSETGK